ncbi:MFS transporter [Bacillus sp. AFS055030]|uniref:MFS transporter n=1 Tax=Bacillus sp. AFS055030 TaxID=2033507 RepID=UPI000BFCB70F|nr:MFS transporter [Bacillus sp. AFS055030]PGL69344.1 MFS transporter [Bacillus sp. AFS055030]
MSQWKEQSLLIIGIGISNLGNWIYLIALNIAILNLTGSASAVAGIYVIRPIATLLTNTWSGSIIDRVNKRKILITVDLIRGSLIFVIPFLTSIWSIYGFLLVIGIFSSFFGPSSNVYITKLIPSEKKQRFNSLMSMTGSGAFLLGPALAGILIMTVGTDLCIFINALSFFVCAFCIYLLPNIDVNTAGSRKVVRMKTLINDWKVVIEFAKASKFFILIFLLFQGALLIGFALDSQEATFIKQHLHLTDRDYGFITSVTGIGSLAGSFLATLFSEKVSIRIYTAFGMLFTTIFYFSFYSSVGLFSASISFILLGFFMSFTNSGFATFFQKYVPTEIMGRFGSLSDMFLGMIQIGLTLLLGFFAEVFSLQQVCLIFSGTSILVSLILIFRMFFSQNTIISTDKQKLHKSN